MMQCTRRDDRSGLNCSKAKDDLDLEKTFSSESKFTLVQIL